MKIFAFFLPQFHTIPENDAWWGKGFTEWTNVKAAKPLFWGHKQPVHPMNSRYYNLLEKETVEWQTELIHKYSIDGLIYYHYYFDGKLLLEKPAENLLKWKEINQPFFFCWANHPWRKTWNGTREILMPLTYGEEASWEKHFQYLLPFFRDSRYEKKDNMPLFMVLESKFEEKEKMFAFLDRRCREEGFDGLYLIESYFGEKEAVIDSANISPYTKGIFFREPLSQRQFYTNHFKLPVRIKNKVLRELRARNLSKIPPCYSGNAMMKHKLKSEPFGDRIIHGLWFEWDSTPRHKERGYIIMPYRKEYFDQYMNQIKREEYLFINAWNEWCEGMILEPTEEKGFRYLEWIREWREKNSI